MKAIKLHGHHFFDRKHYDGKEYFTIRATTGISYIIDVRFYGELVVNKPCHCAVLHSIPSY
jgi:hypothetical protein